MPPVKHLMLAGWGNTPSAQCAAYRPEKERDTLDIITHHRASLIARGLGRAYGDCALQPDGVILSERLDHLIEFDQNTGVLRAQAGVTLADVMAFAIPRGFLPPVIPGTQYVTLGGAFACNVHGKNQYAAGEFAEHVSAIRLLRADGRRIECGPREHSDIFWATAGGMGMTGIIEEITLQLKPIASTSLRSVVFTVDAIDDMIGAFERHKDSSDYMVGWFDHMARGEALGRGVFEAATHAAENGGRLLADYVASEPMFSVPCDVPGFMLNRYSMAVYNRMRFKKFNETPTEKLIGFDSFFHPLDKVGNWNRLYGKRGFFQYQCLFPEKAETRVQIRQFLHSLQKAGLFSFLAVIKYHRPGKGFLSFSKQGYSLALDFKNSKKLHQLIPQINRFVAEAGGTVYLAKDALLDAESFNQMYGDNVSQWRELVHEMDPMSRFTSLMSERLQWKRRA